MSNQTNTPIEKLDPEEEKMWEIYFDAEGDFAKYLEEEAKKEQDCLKEVKKILSGKKLKIFLDLLKELEDGVEKINFRISSDKPRGDEQGYDGIKCYVDQYSVGQNGDSYEGTIAINIIGEKYLFFDYSC